MFIRAYLRASTESQNASRARSQLENFAQEHGQKVASWYVENESGTRIDRPELRRLLSDAQSGDILLLEQVDRLTRLSRKDWEALKGAMQSAGVRVVSLDLPTSHTAMRNTQPDDFTGHMLDAVNGMLLDVLAAVSRKDYEDRRRRQAQGIARAKAEGRYRGKPRDQEKRKRIATLLEAGLSIRKAAMIVGASTATVQQVKREGV